MALTQITPDMTVLPGLVLVLSTECVLVAVPASSPNKRNTFQSSCKPLSSKPCYCVSKNKLEVTFPSIGKSEQQRHRSSSEKEEKGIHVRLGMLRAVFGQMLGWEFHTNRKNASLEAELHALSVRFWDCRLGCLGLFFLSFLFVCFCFIFQ